MKTIAGLTVSHVARLMKVNRTTPYRWLESPPPIVEQWIKERERRLQLEKEVHAMHNEMFERMKR